jgi:hypothetical protein
MLAHRAHQFIPIFSFLNFLYVCYFLNFNYFFGLDSGGTNPATR